MEITEAEDNDLPEMIALLKRTLGEKSIPKSEELFLWKHERNPFGKSKTLLAKESGKVIGLRTFMHWRWVKSDVTIKAVRAVDTATDPAFQGKGIFKQLTLQAVEACINEGIDMVYNTPNPISLQGYLKMGWKIAGRMPVYVGPGNSLPQKWDVKVEDEMQEQFPVSNAEMHFTSKSYFYTPLSSTYIKWRYHDCPIVKYGAVHEFEFGFIFRLKPLKRFMELRICEIWSNPGSLAHAGLNRAVKNCINKFRPLLITCAPSPLLEHKPLKLLMGPFNKGPLTTVRPLAMKDMDDFKAFKLWQPSMGSLELF